MSSKKRLSLRSALRKAAMRWMPGYQSDDTGRKLHSKSWRPRRRKAHPLPKISIIVPIYNTEAHVEKCLRSIMGQTLSEIEIICVDDASPDNSSAIVKRLARKDGRISLIRHESNRGLGGARNTGITAARAPFVTGVDSDDWIEPNMMARLWEASGEGVADITTCGIAALNNEGKLLYYMRDTSGAEQIYYNDKNQIDILNFLLPSFCNKIIRKSLFTANKIEFPESIYFEDLATTPRLLRFAKDIRVISDPLYCYVQRDNSIVNSTSSRHILDYFRVFDILTDFLIVEGLMDRYHDELFKRISNSLHYHTRYLTRTGAVGAQNTQSMRFMILMKLAYLEYNMALRTEDPARLPDILLKATSRDDLESMLASGFVPKPQMN
jgi:glycosyltransferase involved in cell wall biosynthesis